MSVGTYWYIGVPKCGKTTLAEHHVRQFQLVTKLPVAIIDCRRVSNFATRPHLPNLYEVGKALAARRDVVYSPSNASDFHRLCAMLEIGGNCHAILDEVNAYCDSHLPKDHPIDGLMREARHRNVSLHFTTQYVGDLWPRAFSYDPTVYVFCSVGSRNLKRIEDEFDFSAERVSTIPQYKYLTYKAGF